MKRFFSILLIPLFVFAFSGLAFGWGAASGDGESFTQLQETAVFFNNTGEKVYHGWAITIDTGGSNVSSGTTLGSYAEAISSASSVLVVGIAQGGTANGWIDQSPIVVVTKGPVLGVILDSTDAVTSGASVGTSSGAGIGAIGGGDNLGIALEAGDGTDYDEIIIWVAPSGAAD